MAKMNPVVKIFMERDGMDEYEARGLVEALKEDIQMLIEDYPDPFEAYEEVAEELPLYGLEPDYLDYLLF